MLFTANYRTVHTSYSDEAFHLGGLYIPVAKLIAFVVAMGLSGALWLFLHATDLGKAMRAASQNRDVATLMGIKPQPRLRRRVRRGASARGRRGLAPDAVLFGLPIRGPGLRTDAFVAVVLGTLGNVSARWFASLMMGVANRSAFSSSARIPIDRGVRDACC